MSGRRTNPELTAAPYKYPQPRRLSKRFAYLLTPLCLAAEATNQPTSLICRCGGEADKALKVVTALTSLSAAILGNVPPFCCEKYLWWEEGRKEHGERPPCKSEVRPSPKSLAREDRDSMPSSSKRLEIQRLQRLKCTKALMKNFFSYQSCTKKRFQVFTTQCCPSSSLKPDSPLPSYPKPPKRRSKETSDPQCSSCHKRKRERKEK